MKKRLSVLLCTVMTAFLVTACTSADTMEYDKDMLEESTEVLIQYCAGADETVTEQWKSLSDYALEYQLMQSGLPFTPEGFIGALDAWANSRNGMQRSKWYMTRIPVWIH